MTKPNPSSAARAASPAQEAQIDRLIALASEPASAKQDPTALTRQEAAALASPSAEADEPGKPSFWKSLSHLKGALPYVSKLLPLLDARFLPLLELLGAVGPQNSAQTAALTKETRENFAALQVAHQDLVAAVREQSLDIKELEEQIVQLSEAHEKNVLAQAEFLLDVRSVGTLIRAVGAGLAILLVIVILMLGAVLTRTVR
jgi:hypothetical protein